MDTQNKKKSFLLQISAAVISQLHILSSSAKFAHLKTIADYLQKWQISADKLAYL